ncbi:hypothetical protein ZWY2020_006209 [Hordeum vulgare]|nr:hypothetical protein ZWY2020_006209 [Hordeum vulgare]
MPSTPSTSWPLATLPSQLLKTIRKSDRGYIQFMNCCNKYISGEDDNYREAHDVLHEFDNNLPIKKRKEGGEKLDQHPANDFWQCNYMLPVGSGGGRSCLASPGPLLAYPRGQSVVDVVRVRAAEQMGNLIFSSKSIKTGCFLRLPKGAH